MAPILGIFASQISGKLYDPGAYDSIATVTVGSGGTGTITFSSIPQTYTHLQIRGILRANSGGSVGTDVPVMRFNSDTGSNYTSNHVLFGNGSSAAAGATAASQTSGFVVNFPGSGATSNSFGVVIADILDYTNTNKYKTVRGLGGYDGNDTNGIVTFRSFAWMNTNAVNTITLSYFSDFAQYSSFALYGVKGQ